MKIVPKAQYGRPLVALSDNTRVAKPIIERKILYKLKPGELFFTNRNTGKKILIKPRNETISADRRNTYLKKLDEKRTQQLHRLYEEDKRLEEGMKNLLGFLTFVSPSTYIGPVFNNNGKSYAENVMSGEGTGDVAGNVAIDILTPFTIGGAKSLATNMIKYPLNVGRRAVETAMRTTPFANPLPEISNNFHIMLQGNNGGKTRLFHIGNYLLTGKRVGPKGYYNSFAPFVLLNDVFVSNPSLKDKIKAFTQPEGASYAFSGYVTRLGLVPQHTGGNDMIDAFLYLKTIDPKYGVRKMDSNYGIHTDYVNKYYPNKKILVYEVLNNSNIPESLVISKSSWVPSSEASKDFGASYNNILNAAGHLKLMGTYNGQLVRRRLDIWKFNPAEYKLKWFENRTAYTDEPLWKRKLLDMGLRYVDNIGTPVITKTRWVYGK